MLQLLGPASCARCKSGTRFCVRGVEASTFAIHSLESVTVGRVHTRSFGQDAAAVAIVRAWTTAKESIVRPVRYP